MRIWRTMVAGALPMVACGLVACGGAAPKVAVPGAGPPQRPDLFAWAPADATIVMEADLGRLRRSKHLEAGRHAWNRLADAVAEYAGDPSASTVFHHAAELLERADRIMIVQAPSIDGDGMFAIVDGIDQASMAVWLSSLAPGRKVRATEQDGRTVLVVGQSRVPEVARDAWAMSGAGTDWLSALQTRLDAPMRLPSNPILEALWNRLPSDAGIRWATRLTKQTREGWFGGAPFATVDVKSIAGFAASFSMPASMDLRAVALASTPTAATHLLGSLRALGKAEAAKPLAIAFGLDTIVGATHWQASGKFVVAHASLSEQQADQWFYLATRIPAALQAAVHHANAKAASPKVKKAADTDAVGDVPRFRVPVDGHRPQLGPDDAPVTIVEFADFQCPFCGRVESTLERIRKTYGDDVRIVWRNNPLPFHQSAMPAAEVAMEAYAQGGDALFWKMHDLLFAHQQDLGTDDLTTYGKQLGMDVGALKKALATDAHGDVIAEDQALAKKIGALGTPAFFIDGRKLMGAQPFDVFAKVIDDELERAHTLERNGMAASDLYAAFMASAALRDTSAPEPGVHQPQMRPDPNAIYKVPVTTEPVRGRRDALVTIVEVADFQCPFCKRAEEALRKLRAKYGRELRIVWINYPLPFHEHAKAAAITALEAYEQGGNRMFWRMHDLLFEHQQDLGRDTYLALGRKVGMNVKRLEHALDTEAHADVIKAQEDFAQQIGVTGTPSFFINGRSIRGAQPFASFDLIVQPELAKARKLLHSGVPRAKIYATIIEHGATSPQLVQDDGRPAPPPPPSHYDIAIPRSAPHRGPRHAPVVIQEFADFECPFCARVQATVDQIMKEYDGKVELVFRNYPLNFHTHARLAHQAAMEVYHQAGNAKFWAYYHVLFDNRTALERADLERYAEQLGGIDMKRFRRALDRGTRDVDIKRDMKAIEDAGAHIGTPSFFINGHLLQGAQPIEAFRKAIDAALKAAAHH